MPTLFDSHEEFSEWFSKDIESHAQEKTNVLNQSLCFYRTEVRNQAIKGIHYLLFCLTSLLLVLYLVSFFLVLSCAFLSMRLHNPSDSSPTIKAAQGS